MSAANLDSLKSTLHRRIQSELPILSLSELQKNYLALKGKNKNNNRNSLSTFHIRQSHNDILIKSPFYDRANCTNKKGACKCQFHKRQKLFVQKLFPFEKKPKILKQLDLDRVKTLGKQSLINQKKHQKNSSMQRFSTRVTQTEEKGTPNQKFQKMRKLIQQNKQQYIEYLKLIKQKNTTQVDCHNLEFEQFLKTNRPWILRQSKQKKSTLKPNPEKMVSVPSDNSRHHLRFKTVPSNYDDEEQDNIEKNKLNKPSRKNYRKFTETAGQDSFSVTSSTQKQSISKYFNSMEKLKPEERSKLQQFYRLSCQQIGLNYNDLKTQALDNIGFFQTLCKKINDSSPIMVENAKKVLKRISKLPLNLYSTVLREIKNQIQTKSSKSISQETQNNQSSISIAFDTIQNSIGDLVKNRYQFKGREKLTLLGKLKSLYVGRSFGSDSKSKHRQSSNSLNFKKSTTSKQHHDPKKSKFVSQKQTQQVRQGTTNFQNSNETTKEMKIPLQRRPSASQEDQGDYIFKQKHHQLKKKHKMKRQKIDSNIMKMIDEEIQQQLNSTSVITKEFNSKISGQYERQRDKSRKIHRDEELRKHLQFMSKMQQRANERQLTISEQQINNNSIKADYVKNKIFTRKVQHYLNSNSDLKQMIIKDVDNLLTKKRKIRVLSNMIDELFIEKPYPQFYRDMKRYVQIFQKICNMPVKDKKGKQYKKLTRNKSISNDDLYEQDFRTKQQSDPNFGMDQLMNWINLESNQLRFYKIGNIHLEEEDLDEIISEFLNRPIEQKKALVNKVVDLNEQIDQKGPVQRAVVDEDLVQVDLDNDSQKISMQKFYSTEHGQSSRFSFQVESESREIRRLKSRFMKNMQKYQKAFNTTTTFTSI